MTHTIEIKITPGEEAKCRELGALLCAYPLDVLDTVLRDPAVQDSLGRFIELALDRHLALYRRRSGKPQRLVFPQ